MSRSYTSSPPKRLHGVLRDCFYFTTFIGYTSRLEWSGINGLYAVATIQFRLIGVKQSEERLELRRGRHQLLSYADSDNLLGEKMKTVKKKKENVLGV
jgi:hypothetical protein